MTRRSTIRWTGRRMAGRAMLLAGMTVMGMTNIAAQAQTLLASDARYPRIRLLPSGELIASVLSYQGDDHVKIFSSVNNGVSFTQVGTIADPEFQTLKSSSPSLFRVPQTVGSLNAGDLILGIAVDTHPTNTNRRTKINIYRSTDDGRTWAFLSVAVRSANAGGLWEPDFSMGTDGAIVMHYADESSDCCSQKLVRRRTYDGINWVDHTNTVALDTNINGPNYSLRPGMSVVSNLANGTRFMTYEICGPGAAYSCSTYYKTSTDGWNYGAVNTPGTRMEDSLQRFFAHTPVNKVLPDGSILWLGQVLKVANGNPSGFDGTVIYKSASGNPNGPWTMIDAPVPLPNPTASNNCEGFSPGLQWISGGATLVQLTTRLEGGVCKLYFGSGPTS
ncbi:exo-alpha-sialidase [Sphingomonas sp. G-3-2-10]|uniref:exo-alpha-sialidase n=1 Tax=Sphingomonas sp. G-3-2-10 TaxID=2728838 RepID=UPI00146EBAC2|nr:exo-alpha-sialidase [Sphingomonas sp. G-3-2-10]NML07800.1 exo-alpha-sialidase [Sphingomonas sp. G-3-2-10]